MTLKLLSVFDKFEAYYSRSGVPSESRLQGILFILARQVLRLSFFPIWELRTHTYAYDFIILFSRLTDRPCEGDKKTRRDEASLLTLSNDSPTRQYGEERRVSIPRTHYPRADTTRGKC